MRLTQRTERAHLYPYGLVISNSRVTTIERFIIDQESKYPEATGELSNLLYDIALAAKIIAGASGGPGW